MNINHIARKLAVIVLMMAFAFTSIPFSQGSLTADAASKTTLYASASGQHGASLSWSKIKGAKGYAVFRNGGAIAHLGKGARSFGDSGLAAGATYSYQVKAYKKKVKKTKMWKNKYTGALRKKKPSKKDRKNWKKVTFKKTTYKYGKKTPVRYITTARAVASNPSTNTGNTGGGGTSGGTGGGTTTPVVQKTKVTTTDYKGKTHELWKSGNSYYIAEAATTPISTAELAQKYDRTVNYTGADLVQENGTFVQKNSITFRTFSGLTGQLSSTMVDSGVYMYNGVTGRLKVAIKDDTASYSYYDKYEKETKTTKYVMKSGYRLVPYYDMGAKEKVTSGLATCTMGYSFDNYTSKDGFISGDVTLVVSYDFSGNGNYEQIATVKHHVDSSKNRLAALDICKSALGENGTGSYETDLDNLSAYISENYEYGKKVGDTSLMMRCSDGAFILETWSIWKWGVYGGIFPLPDTSNPDDVQFWPTDNPYSSRAYWHAQGHH